MFCNFIQIEKIPFHQFVEKLIVVAPCPKTPVSDFTKKINESILNLHTDITLCKNHKSSKCEFFAKLEKLENFNEQLDLISKIQGSVRYWPKRASEISPPPIQSLFQVFCIKIKLCMIFTKGGSFRLPNTKGLEEGLSFSGEKQTNEKMNGGYFISPVSSNSKVEMNNILLSEKAINS